MADRVTSRVTGVFGVTAIICFSVLNDHLFLNFGQKCHTVAAPQSEQTPTSPRFSDSAKQLHWERKEGKGLSRTG